MAIDVAEGGFDEFTQIFFGAIARARVTVTSVIIRDNVDSKCFGHPHAICGARPDVVSIAMAEQHPWSTLRRQNFFTASQQLDVLVTMNKVCKGDLLERGCGYLPRKELGVCWFWRGTKDCVGETFLV